MKKIVLLLGFLALMLISLASRAQGKTGKISGDVSDNTQKIIESATVAVLKAKDSSLAKMGVADKSGVFEIDQLPLGKYLVAVSAVGFAKTYSPAFELNESNPTINLKRIVLTAQSKDLKGVTVTAAKPFIEQKIDRTVVNVDAILSNVGSTALEALEKSPGVTVDRDGNISLKGKQNVMIMIDGRPSYLSSTELANYLRNLPSSAIDQFEIMTNPSAKYDAAGNSGIINIKTKKNKQKGFNGNVTLGYGQGVYWKTNNSFNLNYRTGKVNLFTNGSYNRNNGFQELDIMRILKNPDTKVINALFDQNSFMKRNSENYNLKLGADYFLSKKTTIGIVLSGFVNPSVNDNSIESNMKNAAGVIDSTISARGDITDKWKNGSVNLNFRHQFDSTGREMTADVDYVRYGSNSNQYFNNTTTYPNNSHPATEEILRGLLPVDVNIYSAKVDYAHPFKSGLKLETGVKSSYVKTDNTAQYDNFTSGVWTPDYGKTNHFQYTENVNAAYINMNKQVKKFGFQLGLRFENTYYKGHQSGNPERKDSSFSRNYNNLFPTMFISYAANKRNQFGLSFGRRIDRPAYQDLNPFLFFLDKFTYGSGNPYLQPQYSNNIELSHTFNNFLTTTLNYSHTKDLFAETFEQVGDATIIVRKGNIGKRDNVGIAVSAQVPVKKWWTAILYTNLNYNKFSGELYGESLDVAATTALVNVNNQFKFNKGWSAELSGFYRTKGVEGQIMIKPMGQVSVGVGKQILKGKGTLKFNVRDLFYTQIARGNINFKATEASFVNSRDSRVANLSFVYRFGKPIKGAQARKNIGGAGDEQKRVNVGGQ